MQVEETIIARKAQSMKRPAPKLYTYSEIEQQPIFVNEGRTVVIVSIEDYTISGYVKSSSRGDSYHKVSVETSGIDIIGGSCTCESTHFYGRPCRHMLRLRNAAVRIGLIARSE